MKGIKIGLTLALLIIVLILALLIGVIFIGPIFGFNIMSFLGLGGEGFELESAGSLGQLYDPSLEKDIGYTGFVMGREDGYDSNEINDILSQKPYVGNCISCSGNTCGKCGDVTESNRFKYCLGCDDSECITCQDTKKEHTVCTRVKECLYLIKSDPEYYKENSCDIVIIERKEGSTFDVNTLKNILKNCEDESLSWRVGDLSQEICHFNSDNIATFKIEPPSSTHHYEYYRNIKKCSNYNGVDEKLITGKTISCSDTHDCLGGYCDKEVLDLGKEFNIFSAENGDVIDDYRLYAAAVVHEDADRVHIRSGLGGDWANWACIVEPGWCFSLGTTDWGPGIDKFEDLESIGSYEEFVARDTSWPGDWRTSNIPEEILIKDIVGKAEKDAWFGSDQLKKFYITMYDTRHTNLDYSHDLRFANCYLEREASLDETMGSPFEVSTEDFAKLVAGDDEIHLFIDQATPAAEITSDKHGFVKISIGNLETEKERECNFQMYVCSQDAFAEYPDDKTLEILDFFRSFEPTSLYHSESITGGELIIYNVFQFDLGDKSYKTSEIEAAIETGFKEWSVTSFPYISGFSDIEWLNTNYNDGITPYGWKVQTKPKTTINYNNECWESDMKTFLINEDQWRWMFHNCGDDYICTGDLRVRVAFKYKKPAATSPFKKHLIPLVTFCDSG